jgi:transposase InsO family protein
LTFLRNHADGIAAINMLTVPTLGFGRLFAFVVPGHGRRVILHVEVTAHATALWLARQVTEAFPWDEQPGWLVRDNDGAYGLVFRRRVRAMGIRDRPTMPCSPWQNGHVERLIGSIRRECLDHLIVLNAAHLRRVLEAYAEHYNKDRTHRAGQGRAAWPPDRDGRAHHLRAGAGRIAPPLSQSAAQIEFSEGTAAAFILL